MVDNDRKDIISDIRSMMTRKAYNQPSYNSGIANKVVDKLLIRLGIIVIIGLLGYMVIKDSVRNKQYRCD